MRFCHDRWSGPSPLHQRLLCPLEEEQTEHKVANYWAHGSGWHWELIGHRLPASCLVLLASCVLRPEAPASDKPIWLDNRIVGLALRQPICSLNVGLKTRWGRARNASGRLRRGIG